MDGRWSNPSNHILSLEAQNYPWKPCPRLRSICGRAATNSWVLLYVKEATETVGVFAWKLPKVWFGRFSGSDYWVRQLLLCLLIVHFLNTKINPIRVSSCKRLAGEVMELNVEGNTERTTIDVSKGPPFWPLSTDIDRSKTPRFCLIRLDTNLIPYGILLLWITSK